MDLTAKRVSKIGGKYQEIENKRFEHRGRTPIAFVCDKFPINEKASKSEFLEKENIFSFIYRV